jgi:hypothetical protein
MQIIFSVIFLAAEAGHSCLLYQKKPGDRFYPFQNGSR